MNVMDVIIIVRTTIETLVTVFSRIPREKIKITACCTESTLLTQKPKVPGLTVLIQYKNATLIENLWRIRYTLENTGTQSIIGTGNQTSLVSEGLPLYTKNVKRVIQLSVIDNNRAEFKNTVLCFTQWLPGERMIIEALVESEGEKPDLYIDRHDIINAKVILKDHI